MGEGGEGEGEEGWKSSIISCRIRLENRYIKYGFIVKQHVD